MKDATLSIMPFAPIYDARSRVLVLGSHPSVESKRQGFYYMNPHNRFWPVMQALLGEPLVGVPYAERARVLLAHGVALYDVVGQCNIVGSSDATIRQVQPNDLSPILQAASIDHIFLNGRTAYQLFCRHMPQWAALATPLPSTSAANARWRLADLVAAWQVVRKALDG